jgi:DNA-binding transcriptional LysR family regulator
MREVGAMTNIPTDLLRTLVAVVDQRSFTKAAALLGVTQPAVSAQIKRLQCLLGCDLLDRSAQGVSLTAQGELVVGYARRLLSINDQIVSLGGAGQRSELVIRIGTPSDYVASILPATLARLRDEWPDVRFIARTGFSEPLMRELRNGELDLYIGLSMTPPQDARCVMAEEVVWVRGAATHFDPKRPVPLVSCGGPNIYRRVMVTALKAGGHDWEDVFNGPSIASLKGAVVAGLGVIAITRRRAEVHGLTVWEDPPLPKLPDVYCSIYVREGGANAAYERMADEIAATVFGKPAVNQRQANTAA